MHGCLLGVREMLNYLSHVLIVPSAPSGTLTMLRLASPCDYVFYYILGSYKCGESDGRCVRVSEPNSKGHSVCFLLLNPPSDIYFNMSFVIFYVYRKCSPFLPTSYATPRPDVFGRARFAYY